MLRAVRMMRTVRMEGWTDGRLEVWKDDEDREDSWPFTVSDSGRSVGFTRPRAPGIDAQAAWSLHLLALRRRELVAAGSVPASSGSALAGFEKAGIG